MKKAYFYADNKWRAPQTATLVKYEGIRFIGGAVASGIADIIDLALLEMQHAPSEAKQTREAWHVIHPSKDVSPQQTLTFSYPVLSQLAHLVHFSGSTCLSSRTDFAANTSPR